MDLTTNRVDAMNHYGVAREASAIYDVALKPVKPKLPPSSGPSTCDQKRVGSAQDDRSRGDGKARLRLGTGREGDTKAGRLRSDEHLRTDNAGSLDFARDGKLSVPHRH